MMNKKKYILFTVLVVLLMLLIIFLVGRSFGFFKYVKEGEKVNIIAINGIEVEILNEEVSNKALNLEDAYPVYDSDGLENDPFMFSMTNTASKSLTYTIKVVVDEEKMDSCVLEDGSNCPQLDTKYIKYVYKKNDGTYSEPMILSASENVITSGVIEGNETINSSVIIWIDSEAGNEIMNNYFYGKLIITGEQFVPKNLKQAILDENELIESVPNLKTTSDLAGENGLYKSTATNSGDPTYYFRGNVENNYVSFAGFTWRIVRINEDGTIRIVMQDGINDNATYKFNPTYSGYTYMYYSNSNVENGAKYILDDWYDDKIASNTTYSNRVATGDYYCEEAKVKYSSSYTSGNATMETYDAYTKANFKCNEDGDGNGKGIVNASVGLLTYDEVLHAGGYYGKSNSDYYLYNSAINWWTMSPPGVTSDNYPDAWFVYTTGLISNTYVTNTLALRPVINLIADTIVTGSGTKLSPYRVY